MYYVRHKSSADGPWRLAANPYAAMPGTLEFPGRGDAVQVANALIAKDWAVAVQVVTEAGDVMYVDAAAPLVCAGSEG